MKLTAIFLLVCTLQMSANGLAQSISFSGRNVPLSKVFHAIEEQTGYGVIMEKSIMEAAKPVTVELRNATLDDVFKTCFSFQPWKLKYTISGKTVIVSIVEAAKIVETSPGEGPAVVTGIVTGENGSPLDGATVEIAELKLRGLTNEKGEFRLKGVPNGKYRIQISYVGYESYHSEVSVGSDLTRLVANMRKASTRLDQVQVIAYGTTTRRLSTGDVTTINAEDLEKQPVANALLALQGRVPGLFITQSTGFQGSDVKVQIMGQNSIGNGNDPLYVIDGVPYSSQLLPGLNTGVQGGSTSPFTFINPSDIESISVLKDADATSIYGSRAANGAILITTKKGKAGATKVDFNLQSGIGQDTRRLKLLNTQQYLAMRHQAIANDGATVGPTDYDLNGAYDTTSSTDWQKKLLGGKAQYTTLSGTISGGSANIQYLVDGTYHRETTVFPGDFADTKGAVHFNLNNVSPDQKFRFQLNGNYMFDKNQLPFHDLTADAVRLAPDAPALYNKDGNLNWAPDANGSSTFYNPLSNIYTRSESNTNNLVSNAVVSYRILPGLEIKANIGYTNLQTNETVVAPSVSQAPENRSFYQRLTLFGSSNINSWIVEPQASYKASIGRGKLEVIAGESIQQKNSQAQQVTGLGFSSDLQMYDITNAPTIYPRGSTSAIYKYNAVFGRVNFAWADRYILDLSARRDGSSRFGSANQFHNFGSAAAGWIFSNENFFKDFTSVISFGKLTASYGTTGNDQIGDYRFLSLYTPVPVPTSYQGTIGVVPSGLANPYLEWEETRKFRTGLDIGFLKDRILINADYFMNRSSNQLLSYTLPLVTGFSFIGRNFPATVENSGLELSLSTININTRDFNWSTHFNLTIPRNKLVSFKDLASSYYSGTLTVGQPVTSRRVFHLLGVNDSTGIYQFADSKGAPTSNPNFGVDNTAIVNNAPKFYGGFQNTFSYKGLQLDVFFQFVKQTGPNYYYGNMPGVFSGGVFLTGNQPTSVLGAWQKPGDKSPIQRYNADYSLALQSALAQGLSDASFSDASYIRLKNLSLSWQLPETWTKKARMRGVKFYLQGQNLLTITKYKGLDPETGSSVSLPPLRVVTAGIQLSL